MSHLIAPERTVADGIPLWLRIREIMKEQGSSYSLTAIAGRLGISRETLRKMLNGEREIYSFELEKLSKDLKVSISRLLQEDLIVPESITILCGQCRWNDALKVARRWQDVAMGLSERANALNKFGLIYLWRKDYDEARRYFEEMLLLAQEINAKYDHDCLLRRTLRNLLSTCADMKETERASEIIEIAEPYFQACPVEMGLLYYSKAKINKVMLQPAEAKLNLYKSLELYSQGTTHDTTGRGYIAVATAEFADRNYAKAKELLESAISVAESDTVKLTARSQLAKTLFKLGEYALAEALIHTTLAMEAIARDPDCEAKLLILRTRITRDARYAEQAAVNLSYSIVVRFLAYRYLSIQYKQERFQRGELKRPEKSKGRLTKRRLPLDTNF
ncbi:helix-turn-helix domain-containing protein [Tumebacillus avium]|nr:helix-turn-helix transcriptional regulator [Tumebacillus avium]